MHAPRFRLYAGWALMGCFLWLPVACSLNPQPFPPAEEGSETTGAERIPGDPVGAAAPDGGNFGQGVGDATLPPEAVDGALDASLRGDAGNCSDGSLDGGTEMGKSDGG